MIQLNLADKIKKIKIYCLFNLKIILQKLITFPHHTLVHR